jgi:hypothetical protein
MMAMTTNSSMSVNPCFDWIRFMRRVSFEWKCKTVGSNEATPDLCFDVRLVSLSLSEAKTIF